MKYWLSLFLFAILLAACGAPATMTNTPFPPTATAAKAPTAIPTPTPIEVAPGEFVPASQINGYEARDVNGKLIYIQDVQGNWIKATHEVEVAPATAEDWAGFNERLGTDFVVNTDGTVTGVEGLNINMANGEATFNFDGKGTEVYHIGNIKVQEVNGEKRLLVAGYMWNAETTSWEVFNPGFPMEDPRSELGWFMEADVANGNWLRFHQRALEDQAIKEGFVNTDGTADIDKYMEHVFEGALRPTKWKFIEKKSQSDIKVDYNSDGKIDYLHFGSLYWENPDLQEAWNKGESAFIKKKQFPTREGQTVVYFYDLDAVSISINMLNADVKGKNSTTALPAIRDREMVWEHKKDKSTFAKLAEICGVDLKEIEKITGLKKKDIDYSYMIWPVLSSYPDETLIVGLSNKNSNILTDPTAIERRIATIRGNQLLQSASLELWSAKVTA